MSSPLDDHLPPSASRAIRSRTVRLVVLVSLVAGLVPCLLWSLATYSQLLAHFDHAGPLALEWSAERVRARLEEARVEIRRIGGQASMDRALRSLASGGPPGDPRNNALAAALRQALDGSPMFAALVVVDREGDLVAVAGSGPGLESLLEMLVPKSALDSELVAVMQGVHLRKELGGVETASIRVLDSPAEAPLPLACAPVRPASGRPKAALHGLVRRDAIAAVMRSDLLGAPGSVALTDGEGRVLAASESAGDARRPLAGVGDDFWAELLRVVGRGWSLRYERPLDALGWTVVAEAPVLTGFRPLGLTLVTLVVLPLAFALGFGAFAFGSGTRMARPLWSLYKGMRKAALEADPVEVEVRRARGEAESLILAFNATIRRLQAKNAEAERSNRALREQNQAFQAQHENLSKLTVTDPLTQLSNRRHFEEQICLEIKRLSRLGDHLSMLMIDIDDFKMLNDRHGHAAGDEFLRQIAHILRETVRATDLVARYGGEEFVVVATGTTQEGGVVLAEKLRTAVAEASFIVDESKRPRRATVSVGVAEYRGSQTDLFNAADGALYEAKAAGKNCVMAADDAIDALEPLDSPD